MPLPWGKQEAPRGPNELEGGKGQKGGCGTHQGNTEAGGWQLDVQSGEEGLLGCLVLGGWAAPLGQNLQGQPAGVHIEPLSRPPSLCG